MVDFIDFWYEGSKIMVKCRNVTIEDLKESAELFKSIPCEKARIMVKDGEIFGQKIYKVISINND